MDLVGQQPAICIWSAGLSGKSEGLDKEHPEMTQHWFQQQPQESSFAMFHPTQEKVWGDFYEEIAVGDTMSLGSHAQQASHSGKRVGFSDQATKRKSLVGVGSFGTVIAAIHTPSQTRVVLKVVERKGVHSGYYTDFVEHDVFNKLLTFQHPNVVKYVDFIAGPTHVGVVMLPLQGEELSDFATNHAPLTETQVQSISKQCLQAVAYTHSRGIIHRDIKTDSFRFERNNPIDQGKLVLFDFGLCKDEAIEKRVACGTVPFVAPEVRSTHYGTPVDVWSLGVVLYTLLTGSYPFDVDAETRFEDFVVGEAERRRALEDIEEYWPRARDFAAALLTIEAAERLTAAKALEHEWLSGAPEDLALANLSFLDPVTGAAEEGGCGGPLSSVAEMGGLFCRVPGFWRLCLFYFCMSAGWGLPGNFFLNPLSSQVWKDDAVSYTNWTTAGMYGLATIGTPYFAMWSDGRPRKVGVTIVAACLLLRDFPLILAPLGLVSPAVSLWTRVVLYVLTGPFVPQLSGSPVLWAWMSDILPLESRETGFSLVFAIGSFSCWLLGTVLSAFDVSKEVFLWVGMFLLVVQLLLILTAPSGPATSPAPSAKRQSLGQMLCSPFQLVARKRSLRLICGVACFVTLADVAVTYSAIPLVYALLKIDGEGHEDEQQAVTRWFGNFPNILLIPLTLVIGVFAKRFGPAHTLFVWTPIASVLFAGPALLAVASGPAVEVLAGAMMLCPMTIYPSLQALVAVLVPPKRIGEAMGAVAACKNLCALISPLVMGVVTQTMEDQGHTDLYWMLFVAFGLIMLVGAWPFCFLLMRRIGRDTTVKWSVWTSVAIKSSVARSPAGQFAGQGLLDDDFRETSLQPRP